MDEVEEPHVAETVPAQDAERDAAAIPQVALPPPDELGEIEFDFPEIPAMAAAGEIEEIVGIEEIPMPGELEIKDEGIISYLEFKELDIRDVLRMFSRKFGVNIVTSPAVVDMFVSMELTDVYWEDALKIILDMNKLVMQKRGNIIRVITAAEVALEPVETRVYKLSYTNAKEAREILAPLVDRDRGAIQIDAGMNKLIITDVPARFTAIEKVIEELDVKTRQVLIKVNFIETSADNDKDLGVKWDSLDSYELSGTNLKRQYEKRRFLRTSTTDSNTWTTHYSAPGATLAAIATAAPISITETHNSSQSRDPDFDYREIIKTAIISADDL
ncbi:MAG: hypothetical protein KAI64_06315, partial [Thermoplasmata archaeon]|nr:hypothetical protein [Thermoplasmata archaeon]